MGINCISISDVHIGVNALHPKFIPNNLRKTFFKYLNDDLDILFIVGDWFDTLLDIDGQSGYEALCIVDEILELAVKHDFIIRVLQGTFTHDRRQNQIFKRHNLPTNKHGEEIVKLFDSINIEYIERFNIRVMYIPDDLPYKNCMGIVREKMESINVEKVDFILNHGYFKHLLPIGIPHQPPNTLCADVMSKLVKGCVLNGHVHTSCVFKKVLNNGSVDRLNHGEEEPKGFFYLTYDTTNSTLTHKFIENVNATIFKTIDLQKFGANAEEAIAYTSKIVSPLFESRPDTEHIFIRIASDDLTVRQSAIMYVGQKYANARLSSKPIKKQDDEESVELLEMDEELPEITEVNLVDMVVEFSAMLGDNLDVDYVKEKLNDERKPIRR